MKDYINVMLLNFEEANHFYSVGNEPRGNHHMKRAEMFFNLMTEAEFLKAREMFSDHPPSQWILDEMECCFAPDRILARLDASS